MVLRHCFQPSEADGTAASDVGAGVVVRGAVSFSSRAGDLHEVEVEFRTSGGGLDADDAGGWGECQVEDHVVDFLRHVFEVRAELEACAELAAFQRHGGGAGRLGWRGRSWSGYFA